MKFCRFLSWSSGYEMHPSPSVCDHWNRRSLNIVMCRLFIEARVCLLDVCFKEFVSDIERSEILLGCDIWFSDKIKEAHSCLYKEATHDNVKRSSVPVVADG